jgi:taurine dioxygenase
LHPPSFRDQRITPTQQVDFSRRFGSLQTYVLHQFRAAESVAGADRLERRRERQAVGLGDAGVYWHSDLSYKERPSLGSLLHAQKLPAEGGDTLFANQHLAWDTPPEALRAAVHSNARLRSGNTLPTLPST